MSAIKKFSTAVENIEREDAYESKVKALMAEKGISREEAEAEADGDVPIEFELDGRTLKAYPPTPGQLAFMMAVLGRGQNDSTRIAGMINLMLNTMRDSDADYFEGRLLSRERGYAMPIDKVEEIFGWMVEEWFKDPTQESSDSSPTQ